jgi:hypothetical protein
VRAEGCDREQLCQEARGGNRASLSCSCRIHVAPLRAVGHASGDVGPGIRGITRLLIRFNRRFWSGAQRGKVGVRRRARGPLGFARGRLFDCC